MKQLKINKAPRFEHEEKYGYSETAWIGHRYFVYDLISNLKPKIIVELGTHGGVSFFSMAQAVKDFQLSTKLHAVDTWRGDKHSGFYSDEVYLKVKKIRNDLYKNIDISFLKKTFDEANKDFKKNSIDLLHIDGLHTYEAVKHDFENWLPKVKKNGIILFHDIAERGKGFGVWKLWKELKKEYKYAEFQHFHGLGVIFKGKRSIKFDTIYQNYYSLLQNIHSQKLQLSKQHQIIINKDKKIKSQDKMIETKDRAIKTKDRAIKTKDRAIKTKDRAIKTKDRAIKQYEQDIELRDQTIHNLTQILNQIKSSKVFRAWQAFNKFKKIVKKLIKQPSLIIKAMNILMTDGVDGLMNKQEQVEAQESKIRSINDQYQIWLKKNLPSNEDLLSQKKKSKNFKYRPKISIVTPVYNPEEKWLRSCIESVIAQTYDNWELCLADDNSPDSYVKKVLQEYDDKYERIKVVYRKENGHISQASNSAFELATGEFVGLLDHDDDLAPQALFKVVELLNDDKKVDFIYSDEDKLELDETRVDPFFKPDWSPDMLMSTNYICHFSVIRKKLIDKAGGFRKGYEGSQDYDLFLRVTEQTEKIEHIPDILYSWRKIPESTAAVYEVKNYCNQASINSLNDALDRRGLKGHAEDGLIPGTFRTKYEIIGNPLVSIVIPTKDKVDYLERCVESVLEKSTYDNYEIIITDTGSEEEETHQYYDKIKNKKEITIINWDGSKFNYSVVNNFAVDKAKGEYILLLNNDTEVIEPSWIEAMLEYAQKERVGAVGAKLLYPDGKIQHAGVTLGINGVASHASQFLDNNTHQAFPVSNSKDMVRNFSAVTAACLMINKDKYNRVSQLDEKYRIAFNDIDFCLKLSEKGYDNVYTPHCKLLHYESISVGAPEKGTRDLKEFKKEIDLMIQKWDLILENDPFYNKNLTLEKEDFSLRI